MKRLIVFIALMTMLLPVAVFSQEVRPEVIQQQRAARAREIQTREREMEMREREMGLQQREAEMNFQQEQQQLELETRRIDLENARQAKKKDPHPLLILLVVIHILCAIWVYQDIQKRARESGIWLVIALLSGLLGTLVYAIVRLGNGTKIKA